MKTVVALLAALQLLTWLTVCLCRSGDTWTQMQVQCLTNATPIHSCSAFTEQHCSMLATDLFPTGILIAQFRPASRQCALYRHQSVCRQMVSGVTSDCQMFIRFPISYPSQLSSKLANVWLGDDMTGFENVLCQADEETNCLYPIGVQWTEEGATFDGNSAHLTLNKSAIGFYAGVTVLLRMKRTPQAQPFVEFLDCNNFASATLYHTTWEYNSASKFYAFFKARTTDAAKAYTTAALLPGSPAEWINVGFTMNFTSNSWGVFLNSSFLPSTVVSVQTPTNFNLLSLYCFRFGKRHNDNRMFRGTVRAIAISSGFMTENEIRDFFALIQ